MSEEKVIQIESKIEGDVFDNLDKLRAGQDFSDQIGVKKLITTIPVRRPSRTDWIRVHPEESYHSNFGVLEVREDREHYIVIPDLYAEVPSELIRKVFYVSINMQNVLFLWPVRLPDEGGRLDEWNRSAHKAAQQAMEGWVRVAANRSLGAYDVLIPKANREDPEWPDISVNEIYRIGFRDNIISEVNHPLLKRLRGEI